MKLAANTHATAVDQPADHQDDDPFNFGMPVDPLNVAMPQVGVESTTTAGKKMAKDWIAHSRTINWNNFKHESNTMDLSGKKLLDLIRYADPFMWFRLGGKDVYPAVSLLAREFFAKMDSTAIQERMFSAASAAMTNQQTRMASEHHEKRVVLHENAALMGK